MNYQKVMMCFHWNNHVDLRGMGDGGDGGSTPQTLIWPFAGTLYVPASG